MVAKRNKREYRRIYEEHYGPIPEGYHIHHIDFDRTNNDPSNLLACTPEEHERIHLEHDTMYKGRGKGWIVGASEAGKLGGKASYDKKTEQEKRAWHAAGGMRVMEILGDKHPFVNGTAAILGGKAIKGYVELWSPTAIATNKNQSGYRKGDCKRVNPKSDLYLQLLDQGYLTIEEHKKRRAE